jgi:hypothetical protein
LNLGSPEDDEIRNGDLFRRVVALGCSEELALSMIRKDATKVAEGVRITEANMGKVKISAAKYLEGTLAKLPDTPQPAPEPEPTPVLIEVSIEDSKKRSLVRELTAEEKARLADEFITANKPASRFNVFRDSFAEATDQLNYRQYQRERAADVIANRG